MAKIKRNIETGGFLESHLSRFDAAYTNSYNALDPFGSIYGLHTPIDDINRRFIKLDRAFRSQLVREREAFPGCSDYILLEKMKISAEVLLSCTPDAISLEVTNEGSIFYTWRKHDISIYLDHYLVDEFDGKDEVIISVFKNDDKLADFAGSLDEAIMYINNALVSESIAFPAFA